jgi:RES domain-containing protein
MYYTLAPGARLYRITGTGDNWPAPVLGLGAYFTRGGRYNNAGQATVYCAEDPLAAIAEAAFYESLEWQLRISKHRLNPVTYPLISRHQIWCFSIDPAPALIDLEHPQAITQFQHTPHMLLNPSFNPARRAHVPGQPLARDYFGTQDLATEIIGHTPPHGSPDPRPEGIKAPAIRIKRVANYRPHQLALFVFPAAVHVPYENRSNLLMQCELELRFLQLSPRRAVTMQTVDIDWCKPQFRIRGAGAAPIPAYLARPAARTYNPNKWYNFHVQYA